jgi:predicted nucleotidyltransferase
MASLVAKLHKQGLIKPPQYLMDNIHYEVIGGSYSYGCNLPEKSDFDVSGFCIPPKRIVFPHSNNAILDFDDYEKFQQYEQQHIKYDKTKEADITIYNIVRFFRLVLNNNPNMIDILFVDRDCVIHSSIIGEMVRDKRQIFLHKGLYNKFKAYAFGQLGKLKSKNPVGKRKDIIDEQGDEDRMDRKFAYHLVRLISEVEQLLEHQTMDLRKDREHYKAIRRGDFTKDEIIAYASEKEKYLEKLYQNTKLPEQPREKEVKTLLLNCLEHHYGTLDACIQNVDKQTDILRQIQYLVKDVQ